MFNIVSRCKPPRPPTTTLLRTKSANDALVSVPQPEAGTLGHQPIRRSSSYTFHGDGYCDAPTFDLGIDDTTEPVAAAQTREANPVVIENDDLDSVRVNEACVAADAGTRQLPHPNLRRSISWHEQFFRTSCRTKTEEGNKAQSMSTVPIH